MVTRVSTLFSKGFLDEFLRGLFQLAQQRVERLSEDELLSRSTSDLAEETSSTAYVVPLAIGEEQVDGDVRETIVDVSNDYHWSGDRAKGFLVSVIYEFAGDARLFDYRPSHHILKNFEAQIGDGKLTLTTTQVGSEVTAAQVKAAIDPEIDRIRQMAGYASVQAEAHNSTVSAEIVGMIEQRKDRVTKRRNLAGSLGFPLSRRGDAPTPVPLERKVIGVRRERRPSTAPYRDEPALTTAQYEDAVSVVRSTLLAMERTPSVASGKEEEELRDQILVQLNGTFEGAATGETFVQSGKTDILVKVDDRHVFVGECKWWKGPKECGDAIDQLLSYLPWRDEKAALIIFVDRKDASAAIERAEAAVRDHAAYKRQGPGTDDPNARRNFVLGHPGDPDREIHIAVLFAVLPRT